MIRTELFCLVAQASSYLRKQQSSPFCKAVIKCLGIIFFSFPTAVKMVLSRFIQQTVNCRCSHWADPILIIDLKQKEVKDQTNIFFLIFEKLPKLMKLNSLGTKEMFLFFYLFQLCYVFNGTQILQLEYKTTSHQTPLKARSASCNYNATQKMLVYLTCV